MSILGPGDLRAVGTLRGTRAGHLKTWTSEYVDEYSEAKLAPGVPAVRAELQSISAQIGELSGRHSTMHNATTRLPPGHPPAHTYRAVGDPAIGTMTRGAGEITSLKDSALYGQEQTWAHWRVAVDGKPSDTRRKYRGVG
ncbi:hypothetical protein TSOC_007051 [Tetrabaena socialis]|uniref:Uncharacterized protein n=1 Tax=Tetrabaena socialis TaxID=47790 RepID=A0A2J8A250_9CHLO|nr:hypothetical protein TSOC_007051 [Tetrabaena socialis]|eukprot:PNH06593.1 hypothetical protein TSOC_007051 [Tetrabaena socialis]